MSETTTVSDYVETPFTAELLKQMRALDTYDAHADKTPAETLDPYIMTKERKREIPIVGDPDEITMARVAAYYNALATSIELRCGLMAVPMIKLTHEGFGRALISVGKLIVLDKTLRDVHRFGFPTFEKLNDQAETLIAGALAMIEKFNEVAKS
ncbi:NifX-associated nitrogen fixation protein [Blastopirellula sp. JC732]|uniref:NifX-associated nitrogen fixation protein n=1 Tax=Blastopirellula sediminis TaxID=2894196 RepID=A0A9X1MLG5_9BACT|nr:NifX-associated nitrogen fixation protein [Blastopirellula sediminis]MCC9608414.1 NifX-associated nitrogen fixation protein [Blastopirellula sediminis]MCC9628809.1 NifX-associated nitrogen fixation protein [Blastopirellula sediminis]